ncbi:MAG TPA: VCBS repeat-containing protein, partial [Anaerolineales bacterium]
MKQILMSLLGGILFLAACGQTSPITQTLPVPFVDNATLTPSPTPTNTSVPTATATATITPLPTIPSFTPTFDARTIVTVTPAPPASCPKEDPNIVANFSGPYLYGYDDILVYLNAGGTLTQLATTNQWDKIVDLTGDGLSEVGFSGLARYDILGCKDRIYQDLLYLDGEFGVELADILDLNKNGIPELIFYSFSRYGYAEVYIFEWDGSTFRSLIDLGTDPSTGAVIDAVAATTYYKLKDMNGDGLKEIVVVYDNKELCGGLRGLDFCDGTPTRKQITTLGWNGKNFINLKPENYGPPEYRFQAIQDGDRQARYGKYSEALSLYQEAIFDEQLKWWSPTRSEYEIKTNTAKPEKIPTVYPTPILDNTEYPRLAAYAYYRIMLLHIMQGHESDAGTVYKILQQKFGNNQYGRPY